MNTVDDWQTTAYPTRAERRAWWEKILGRDRVPIVSFVPEWASLPGHPDALVYVLDLRALSVEQRQRLIEALAEKFGWEVAEVERELDEQGVPILADEVVVSTTDRSLIMNIVLD